jgi:hypothetical protein
MKCPQRYFVLPEDAADPTPAVTLAAALDATTSELPVVVGVVDPSEVVVAAPDPRA